MIEALCKICDRPLHEHSLISLAECDRRRELAEIEFRRMLSRETERQRLEARLAK
jgi:hypothetical protein